MASSSFVTGRHRGALGRIEQSPRERLASAREWTHLKATISRSNSTAAAADQQQQGASLGSAAAPASSPAMRVRLARTSQEQAPVRSSSSKPPLRLVHDARRSSFALVLYTRAGSLWAERL